MDKKKVALVTGAGAGIGKAIAMQLALDGFALAVNDLRAEQAGALTEELTKLGSACLSVPADVSEEEQARTMIDRTIAAYGRIDVLVNNAGICPIRVLGDISLQAFEQTMRVNLSSVFLCASLAAPHMIRQGGGKIINAASQSAFQQSAVTIEYATSKWAVRGLTRTLAASLGPHNITVNAYCPGKVITDMNAGIEERMLSITGLDAKTYNDGLKAAIPLGRLLCAQDVAGLVSFLASSAADNITGQNIMINGGQVMD